MGNLSPAAIRRMVESILRARPVNVLSAGGEQLVTEDGALIGFTEPNMPLKEVHQLDLVPSATTVASTDIVPATLDPDGTPATYRATIAEILAAGLDYGSIYVSDGSTGQLAAAADTFEKFTTWEGDGAAKGVTADSANDRLTLVRTGHYLVIPSISWDVTNGIRVTWRLAWNGAAQESGRISETPDAAASVVSGCGVAVVDATLASKHLELEFKTHGTAETVTVREATLFALWIGDT